MQTLHMIQPPNEDSLCLARLQKFTAMPHQPMFMLGAIQAVVVMLWWLADIAGRYGGWYTPFQWSIPAPWAHLYLMIFCLFPPYMFGFLMTTYPKWMAGAEISPKHFLPAAALLACGVLLAYVGLIAGKVWFMAAIIIYLSVVKVCLSVGIILLCVVVIPFGGDLYFFHFEFYGTYLLVFRAFETKN